MNNTLARQAGSAGSVLPARDTQARGWQHWAPYAAVAWSLMYAALGVYWAAGGRGFPYAGTASGGIAPLIARFGPGGVWAVVGLAGIPAAAIGTAMLRGVRNGVLRPLFITAGVLLAALLLLTMADLTLLEALGYIPFTIYRLLSGGDTGFYLAGFAQFAVLHQLLCLIGGFLWLGATVAYARRSGDACLYCGRREGPEGWQAPERAARWGRVAVYIAIAVPVIYALTRYAWAVGIPLGMSEEYWRAGQEKGLWIAGLFLANFGLVGAVLMLGLVQRWGEVFPRWMIGLAGRRVPIALAVVPAVLAAVVLFVGGITFLSATGQMVSTFMSSEAAAQEDLTGVLIFQAGPAFLFPVWGAALALGTLGYYFRRRGPCAVCGRGTQAGQAATAAREAGD